MVMALVAAGVLACRKGNTNITLHLSKDPLR
jgi:hypothetical protein